MIVAVVSLIVAGATTVLIFSLAKMGTKNSGRTIETKNGYYVIWGKKLKELELAEMNCPNGESFDYTAFIEEGRTK